MESPYVEGMNLQRSFSIEYDYVLMRYRGLLSEMCWILWLKWNMESLSNVPSL